MTENITRLPYAQISEQSQLEYIVNHLIGKEINTCCLVQVVKVNQNQTIDVKPLVTQLTANDTAIEHNIIHGVPFFRYQAGGCAIILDPVAGDIGLCVFAQNDISGVKSSKKEAPPTSYRRFDYADGIYLGGILNGTPTTYIEMIPATGVINIKAATINIDGAVIQTNGNLSSNGKILHTHTHSGVQVGGGNTGAPN